jgi:hypothetical protein
MPKSASKQQKSSGSLNMASSFGVQKLGKFEPPYHYLIFTRPLWLSIARIIPAEH